MSNFLWSIPCAGVLWIACLAFNYITRPPNLSDEEDAHESPEAKNSESKDQLSVASDLNPYSPPRQATKTTSKRVVETSDEDSEQPGVPVPSIWHAFGISVLALVGGSTLNLVLWMLIDLAEFRFQLKLPGVVSGFLWGFAPGLLFLGVQQVLLIYMLPTTFKKAIAITVIFGCFSYAALFVVMRVVRESNTELTGFSFYW